MATAAKALALLVTLAPTAAAAQINVDWGLLHQSDPMGAFYQGQMQAARMRAMQQAQAQALAELQAQQRAQQLRQAVGQAVAAGQCDEAKSTALSAGDFALAETVVQICTPAAAQADQAPAPSAEPAVSADH